MGRGSSQSRGSSRPSTELPRGLAAATRRRRASSSADGSVAEIIERGSMLRFYTDDAPGLKVSPTTVLVMSICFIAFVISLHVFGKLYRNSSAAQV